MSKIVAEAEGTKVGVVQVIQHDNGLYDVQTSGTEQSEEFTVRHPQGDGEMAIRALATYLHSEAYSHQKLAAELTQIKDLVRKVLVAGKGADEYHTKGSWNADLVKCAGCQREADVDDEEGIQHADNCPRVIKCEAWDMLEKLTAE